MKEIVGVSTVSLVLVMLSVVSLLPLASTPVALAQVNYQANGTFPEAGPMDELQITYSISAVTVTSSAVHDNCGGNCGGQTLYLAGTVEAGATIILSGSFYQGHTGTSDWAGTAHIIASGTGPTQTYPLNTGPTTQSFNLKLTLPTGAQSVDTNIGVGSDERSYGIGVQGSFTVQTAVTSPTSSPTITASFPGGSQTGSPGDALTVSGSGWTPGGTVTVDWGGLWPGSSTVTARSDGSFAFNPTNIPSTAAADVYDITATQGSSSASVTITILPSSGAVTSSTPTITMTQGLDVHVYTNYVGDTGCEISITVWKGFESQNPQQVANANLDIVIKEEGTGTVLWDSASEGGPIITDASGNLLPPLSLRWNEAIRGKTLIVQVTATEPTSGLTGSTETTISVPLTSTELKTVIEDNNRPDHVDFTVKVTAIGSDEPINGATLDLRVFHMLTCPGGSNCVNDGSLVKEWTAQTDTTAAGPGTYVFHMTWDPNRKGDVWRVDVYASKEGYNGEDFTNTHVTEGGDIYFMMNTTAHPTYTIGEPTAVNQPVSAVNNLGGYLTPIGIIIVVAASALLLGRRYTARKKSSHSAYTILPGHERN